jgi:hypothetical protein
MKVQPNKEAVKSEFIQGVANRKNIMTNLRGSHFTFGHEGVPMVTTNQSNLVHHDVEGSKVKPVVGGNELRETHFTMGNLLHRPRQRTNPVGLLNALHGKASRKGGAQQRDFK